MRVTRKLGLLFVLIGLVMNPWLVGYLAADDGSIALDKFAVVLLVDLVFILGGLQLLWRWVDLLAWQRPVGLLGSAFTVIVFATLITGIYWGNRSWRGGHDHTTVVESEHRHATPEQQQWADDFYRRSLTAAIRNGWFDFDTAMTKGFQPDRVNRTHFPNLTNMFDDAILDPERPEWLVYDDTPEGKVLMALMFFTRTPEEVGPTPAGPIAEWHYHQYESPRCAVRAMWTVGRPDKNGRCAEGVVINRTPEMFHVWFMNHPLGHFTAMKIVPEHFQDDGSKYSAHPLVVHFGIALVVVAVLLDLAALVTGRSELHRAAWFNLVLAVLAVAAATVTGVAAQGGVTATHEVHELMTAHRRAGYWSLAAVALMFVWRYALRSEFPRKGALAIVYLTLSVSALVAIGASSLYGTRLVYVHGAGVGAIDRFAREAYWKQVRDIYRQPNSEAAFTGPAPAPAAATSHKH